MLAHIDLLNTQHDTVKRELSIAQDTARTYYERMLQAQSDATRVTEPNMVIFVICGTFYLRIRLMQCLAR